MKAYRTKGKVVKAAVNTYVVNRGTATEYKVIKYTFVNGVVMVYSEPTFASFEFVLDKHIYRMYLSCIKKPLTDRQLIIRAGKFGKEVFENWFHSH